jgi:hypothetical protein
VARAAAVMGLVVMTVFLYWPDFDANQKVSYWGYEVFAVADSLLKNHSFADPFLPLPTGPTAHVPPTFPAYLAVVFAVFGQGGLAAGVLKWAALLMFAAQLAWLPLLTSRLHLGFWTGILAGAAWLGADIPPVTVSDAAFTSLLGMVASYLVVRRFEGPFSQPQYFVWSLVWAGLMLTQPATLLVFLSSVALLHFSSVKSVRLSLALILLPMLLVAPWIARNFVVFHKLFFVRDNLGIEMSVSNRSCATPFFDVNEANRCFAEVHPNENLVAAIEVRELGEIEFNRERMEGAIDWIKGNPAMFAMLSAKRFVAFWFPPVGTRPSSGVILRPWVLDCFTMLSILGIWVMWRKARPSSYVVGLWVLFFPPTYYFIQYMLRYRYPILWATFVPGSYFLVCLAQGIWTKGTDRLAFRSQTSRGARKAHVRRRPTTGKCPAES